MKYTNSTPFPTLCFESIGPEGRHVHTIVVRATTTINPGGLLILADEQLPLNFTDRYFGKPGASSLKYPNDLAPYKPKADIVLLATAYPPGKSALVWGVKVSVGQHAKSLVVIGPRFWKKGLFGWELSPLQPASKQPIRYESAFGGTLTFVDKEGEVRIVDVCRDNPVGKGWMSPLESKVSGGVKTFPAAQFYSGASDLPPDFGKEYAIEGFGAIAPSWSSRQKHVGSWEASEGKDTVPVSCGFDPLFFNCAHPDLIVPYLNGDEAVQLVNLTPDARLDFQLPGHVVFIAGQFAEQEEPASIPAFLDTLMIEPDDMRVTLVWRATVPVEAVPEALEARLIFNEKAAGKEAEHE